MLLESTDIFQAIFARRRIIMLYDISIYHENIVIEVYYIPQ